MHSVSDIGFHHCMFCVHNHFFQIVSFQNISSLKGEEGKTNNNNNNNNNTLAFLYEISVMFPGGGGLVTMRYNPRSI